MPLNIPLSYTPIDPDAIKQLVDRYQKWPHEKIISDFELGLSDFTQAKHVVALNSGTAGIHLALKAIGVDSNDEVLVSTFTYVATVNPILYLGARPIFIDVDKQSWNMDPGLLEKAIQERINVSRKPKAILVVHNYGMPARAEEILNIANRYDIPVVEDAAEALGSRIGNRYVGTFGKIGILSFNNNKILTTYGGGAILTEDGELAQKILFWAGQSRETKLYNEHKELGYNYRIGPINAAVGLSKIYNLEKEIERRRSCFELYNSHLSKFGFQFQVEIPGSFSNRWLTTILIDPSKTGGITREDIRLALEKENIESRPLWKPMHLQPIFEQFPNYGGEVSEKLFERGLCLPSGSGLKAEELKRVVSLISDYRQNL
jgi:dTDP-4-amino-4,6-dideoxygalactose transaminase